MLTLLLQTQANPSASQLTNGHNFLNASKLFMYEQGGAVVTPEPLWLEREGEREGFIVTDGIEKTKRMLKIKPAGSPGTTPCLPLRR